MTYWVTYKVEGRYLAEVNAENMDEALKKAEDKWYDAYFGALQECEGEPVVVENVNGIEWEK